LQEFDSALAATQVAEGMVGKPKAATAPQESKDADNYVFNIRTGNARLDTLLEHAESNPELLAYKLKNSAYKFSFLLVPISLPFIWLLFFWKRDVRLYDHAVFALYSLSFMSLLFVLAVLINFFPKGGDYAAWLLLVPPLHMYAQLRDTYRLRKRSALWRTGALLLITSVVTVLFSTAILAIAVG
jgi:hypothetical protein